MKSCCMVTTICVVLAGCGGSGGNSAPAIQNPPPPPGPPATVQSPGSHWFTLDDASNPVHLYISEAGKVRSIFDVAAVTNGPTFGTGSVSISGTDQVDGVLQAKGIQTGAGPQPVDLGCTLSGMVRERSVLDVTIVCSDANGIVYDEAFRMTPQPGYDSGSSLIAISGNYTLPFRPTTNVLNIASDGTLFGMYHNGANCTVNGVVSIIDASYIFLDVTWTMTNCTDPFGIYEDAEMSGFALASPNPNDPQGSYYFFLTGMNSVGLYSINVTYEPT